VSWLPRDVSQIGYLRFAIRAEGLELLLNPTIDATVQSKVIKSQELDTKSWTQQRQRMPLRIPSTSDCWGAHATDLIGAARPGGRASS